MSKNELFRDAKWFHKELHAIILPMKVQIADKIHDINICYKLREIIFIDGQNVPFDRERDDEDDTATHFLLVDDNNKAIGVARVVISLNTAIIGRLGVLEQHRNKGVGKFLMQNIIDFCENQKVEKIVLGAQEHAIKFYKKLNFEIISEKYMDANIAHFKMQLKV